MRYSLIRAVLALAALLLSSASTFGQLNVFLDFSASWQAELDAAASVAGVAAFTPTERSEIESIVFDSYLEAWDGFDLNIITTDPGGTRDRVDFGATTGSPNQLGGAALDFGNVATGIARVYTANFHRFLETFDSRADQIRELAVSLAGTGIHELAHGFGARHANAYGTPQISPANYANTGGAQNQHFLATGSTGLSEEEREMPRTLSQWAKVVLEVARRVTSTPRDLQFEFIDAGSDVLSALSVPFSYRALSDTDAGYVQGKLTTESDIDWFSFEVTAPSRVTAELWSDEWFAQIDDFDGMLRLIAPDGVTTLASSSNIQFDGDIFGPGSTVRGDDAFLVNIPVLSVGTYFLEVSSLGLSGGPTGAGDYRLLLGTVPVPEPSGIVLAWLVLLALAFSRLMPSRTGLV